MQFGIGILGRGWTPEGQIRAVFENTAPARLNMRRHATCYAAKLAADTLLSEPPTTPDLSDDGLLRHFALCGLPARRSEIAMIRDAFVKEWGTHGRTGG